MLAKRVAVSRAALIGIGISGAVGNRTTADIGVPFANYRSSPIGPDQTTLAHRLPRSIVDYLSTVGEKEETPKAFGGNIYFQSTTLPDSARGGTDTELLTGRRACDREVLDE